MTSHHEKPMSLRLAIDNSGESPNPNQSPPSARLLAAWRAMQGVMRNHLEGEVADKDALSALYGFLDHEELNAVLDALERPN